MSAPVGATMLVGSHACGYLTTLSPETICGQPGVVHFLWDDTSENGCACEAHAQHARERWIPVDEHPIGADCTMPGVDWILSTETDPGYCALLSDDPEHLMTVVALELSDAAAAASAT